MAELVADRAHVAHTSLVDWIGRTPLVRLRRFETREGVELYAKLEMPATRAGPSKTARRWR